MCLCLKEIVGADTCRSPTASVHTLFSALGTRGFYSRAASLQASSPFGGYGEKQTREKRPRGDEKARRRGISPLARAFSRGSLRSPKYSLRSRGLEVVGTRKNERARPFFLAPTTQASPIRRACSQASVQRDASESAAGNGQSMLTILWGDLLVQAFGFLWGLLTTHSFDPSISPITLQLKLYCFSRLRYLVLWLWYFEVYLKLTVIL